DAAVGAVELEPVALAWGHAGGALDHAQRAVLELSHRHGGVVGLDVVAQVARVAGYPFDRAGDPGEQVDAVDALVDQRGAALFGPGAAPARFVVVALRAPRF